MVKRTIGCSPLKNMEKEDIIFSMPHLMVHLPRLMYIENYILYLTYILGIGEEKKNRCIYIKW